MEEKLQQLLKNAKTTYYHFPVACIVECHDGTLFEGINVETASPASGSCAERVALYSALAKGYQKDDIKALYIMNSTVKFCYPCFICRQALLEYCNKDVVVTTYNSEHQTKTVTIEELCPYAFDGEDLK